MNGLLIHGLYDTNTLETLIGKGVKEISFDLRPRSANLVGFHQLLGLLKKLSSERLFLTFENDKQETVLSYLGLLRDVPFSFLLIFRDAQSPEYYQDLGKPFYWMFDPEARWKEIIELPNIQGIFLPLKHQSHFHRLPELWERIEERHLDVYLHAESFEQSLFMNLSQDIKLSIDMTSEIESSFRIVDQEKMKKMKIWGRFHEIASL